MLELDGAAQVVATLSGNVTDDQLSARTPCQSYTVSDLLAHLVGLSAAFRDAARKDLGPSTDTNPKTASMDLSPDWRSRLPVQLGELAAAWREADAWEGETRAGGVSLPAEVAGQVALNELVLHGWDLARATGQRFDCDPASAEASCAFLAQSTDPEDRGEMFGPVVDVPEDASFVDRAVGLSGRDPTWTAG